MYFLKPLSLLTFYVSLLVKNLLSFFLSSVGHSLPKQQSKTILRTNRTRTIGMNLKTMKTCTQYFCCLSVWQEANGTKMPSGVEITIVPLYFVYEVAICKWTTLKKYQLSIKLEECKSFNLTASKKKCTSTKRIKPSPPNRPLIILFDRLTLNPL